MQYSSGAREKWAPDLEFNRISPTLVFDHEQSQPSAGAITQAGAGPELRHHPDLRIWLHRLYRLSVTDRQQDAAVLQHHRLCQLQQALGAAALVAGDHQSRHLRLVLYRHLLGARPRFGDPARPEDPRRRTAEADLSLSDGAVLHRHGDGVEMVSRSRHRA